MFAYANGSGFVGLGKTTAEAIPIRDFRPSGLDKSLVGLPSFIDVDISTLDDLERCEWCLPIAWRTHVNRDKGVHKEFHSVRTAIQFREEVAITTLLSTMADLNWIG